MGNSCCIVDKQEPYYDSTEIPESYHKDWMSRLDDSCELAMLSLPGTHNSMSLHGGALTQCQSWCLTAQLDAGIRWLDIRCRHYQEGLPIYHSMIFQHYNLDEVFRDCVKFLQDHPTEIVVMRIRREWDTSEVDSDKTMDQKVQEHVDKWGGDDYFWTHHQLPTVRESRGKVVILYDYYGGTVGVNYWVLDIADMWDVSNICYCAIETKWDDVRTHLDEASDLESTRMFLTYSSGSSACAHPHSVAWRINPKLYDYITGAKARWGAVAMDFPGSELIERIIHSNF
ncbi:1-phosphatidylinositol phosphodiesterase-like [Saccoglossus kowalevskii]|uniref:Uncharacterized protein LOC100378594 n=1 Tax=Saccoglossus kowalevskii TaxID=10224 RepID=A0ABM0GY76_SACKO|nr:PREDICTED: uncharacterized protein LOC100378594 [Saccoglossus kowalevskii]